MTEDQSCEAKREARKLERAAEAYLARAAGTQWIEGRKRRGLWHPSIQELCECCHLVSAGSRKYPYGLLVHCRTIVHVSHLYRVDVVELRRTIRAMKQGREVPASGKLF